MYMNLLELTSNIFGVFELVFQGSARSRVRLSIITIE